MEVSRWCRHTVAPSAGGNAHHAEASKEYRFSDAELAVYGEYELQALEDVICFVFLRWYFADFAAKHEETQVLDIVEKTARKMSAEGRARVLAEFTLPDALAQAFAPA